MDNPRLLFGSGGHASVLLSLFKKSSPGEMAYLDLKKSQRPEFKEAKWFSSLEEARRHGHVSFSNGIGTSLPLEKRFELSTEAENLGMVPINLISPDTTFLCEISARSGVQVLPRVVTQHSVVIGRHCVLNTSAIIEHDVVLGDGTFVGPGAIVLGGATVGKFSLIGAAAVVLPGVVIGEMATIGAGSVVTKNVKPGETVAGNPARKIEKS